MTFESYEVLTVYGFLFHWHGTFIETYLNQLQCKTVFFLIIGLESGSQTLTSVLSSGVIAKQKEIFAMPQYYPPLLH